MCYSKTLWAVVASILLACVACPILAEEPVVVEGEPTPLPAIDGALELARVEATAKPGEPGGPVATDTAPEEVAEPEAPATPEEMGLAMAVPEREWPSPMLPAVYRVPPDNEARRARLVELLVEGGASADEITTTRVKSGSETDFSVSVVVPGRDPEAGMLVIGAHTDSIAGSPGAVDNWSGTVMLAALHAQIRKNPLNHSVTFLGFACEEHGGRGSLEYVKALGAEALGSIRTMVNLDCLGAGPVRAWVNEGGKGVFKVLRRATRRAGYTVDTFAPRSYTTDAASFEQVGIPALTVHSLTVESLRYINCPGDRVERLDDRWYARTYTILDELLAELDKVEPPIIGPEGVEPETDEASPPVAVVDASTTPSAVAAAPIQPEGNAAPTPEKTGSFPVTGLLNYVFESLDEEGVRLYNLEDNSAEAEAGLLDGDRLTHIGEAMVQTTEEVRKAVQSAGDNGVLVVTIERPEKHYVVIRKMEIDYTGSGRR